jgi:putative phosphoribosyl transferase
MAKDDLEHLVQIPVGSAILEGALGIPLRAQGVVLFAHGSGSSRHSPRNNFVARALRKAGIGTLLFDLLTEEEDATYETRFNIKLLTPRLVAAT